MPCYYCEVVRMLIARRLVEARLVPVRVDDNGRSSFQAFITTKLDSCGTGLRLIVAEGIVHQHGG